MNIGALLNTGLGLLGAVGSARSSGAQQTALRDAGRITGARANLLERLLALADRYDPATEDRAGIDYAGQVTEDTLKRGLTSLNKDFRDSGGNPYGDTLFKARVQGTTDRIGDPLRMKAADLATSRTQRKAAMLSGALGSGGDIAGSYLQIADANQSDPTGSLGLLASGIGDLLERQKGAQAGVSTKKYQAPQGGGNAPDPWSVPGALKRYDTSLGRNDPIRLRGARL